MFTTFTVIKKQRITLGEKLHLKKNRTFISRELNYSNVTFYSTMLTTYSDNNTSSINRFIRRCAMPVIMPNDKKVLNYRYLTLANTIFAVAQNPLNIGLYDPDGSLAFLLSKLLIKSRSVCVITDNPELYASENATMMKTLGTGAIISDNRRLINNCDAVISSFPIRLPSGVPVFCAESGFSPCKLDMPQDLRSVLPEYSDGFCECAILYFDYSVRHLGSLKCTVLQKNGRPCLAESLNIAANMFNY